MAAAQPSQQGTQRVKELHFHKNCGLKLKLPRSLSESRAREVSIVNKCHRRTNSRPECGSEIGPSACHQATGTKKAGSTHRPADGDSRTAPCSFSSTARWESRSVPESPKITLPSVSRLGGKGGGVEKTLFGNSSTVWFIKTWTDGKGEDFQVKRK